MPENISDIYKQINPREISLDEKTLDAFLRNRSSDMNFINTAKKNIKEYVTELNKKGYTISNLIGSGSIDESLEQAIGKARDTLREKSALPLPRLERVSSPISSSPKTSGVLRQEESLGSGLLANTASAIRKKHEALRNT